MPSTELLNFQLCLKLRTEVDDTVTASAAEFGHNNASDEEILAAFDLQALQLRSQLSLYLARREERMKRAGDKMEAITRQMIDECFAQPEPRKVHDKGGVIHGKEALDQEIYYAGSGPQGM